MRISQLFRQSAMFDLEIAAAVGGGGRERSPTPLSNFDGRTPPWYKYLSLPQPSAAIRSKVVAIIFALEILSTRQIYANSAGYEKSRQNCNDSISFLLSPCCFTLPLDCTLTLVLFIFYRFQMQSSSIFS